MIRKLRESIFYGNHFYGICAVALSVEASLQQQVKLNSVWYYFLLYAAIVVFYMQAYLGEINPETLNRRSQWYLRNHALVKTTQALFAMIVAGIGIYFAINYFTNLQHFSMLQWAETVVFPIIALLYYGLSFSNLIQLNLRQTGWLKPFFIGFSWAGVVTIYPLLFNQLETGIYHQLTLYGFFLFIKNWMFITVLSIMFDIKDYAADHNRQLKTFVVRIGLRKTLFYIIIPLSVIGFISYIAFVSALHFPAVRIIINTVPFILLIMVTWSMHKRKSILYYLAVIDGLMLVKAICGIAGVLITN